ncbi:MAG: endolytic transglycosylase MltG [Slackia sp.]|nr:endolytic transglycosylase MltG [Slackia sp.]
MRRKQITYSSHPNHRARMVHAQGERQFRTYDTSHIRPRKSKAPFVIACVLVAIVVAAGAVFAFGAVKGCSADTEAIGSEQVVSSDVRATVLEGATASDVASALAAAGVIPNADDFLARAKALELDGLFQAGTYHFHAGMTLDDVVRAVSSGDLGTVSLTIPEGYKLADIAAAVEQATEGRVSAADFSAAASDARSYASDYAFLADAPEGVSLEGFLFPKTYELGSDATADSIVRMMLSQFKTETASLDWSYPESLGLSVYDAVTLASIVEKESSGDERIRSQVAAVFYNRLSSRNVETNGFLQSDATTAYEVGHDPSAEEVQAATPYSTYANPGLPPTPICSPSIDCLQAVCAPASDYDDYYYFIFWNNDAGEVEYAFSKTYEEHQRAIAEHL